MTVKRMIIRCWALLLAGVMLSAVLAACSPSVDVETSSDSVPPPPAAAGGTTVVTDSSDTTPTVGGQVDTPSQWNDLKEDEDNFDPAVTTSAAVATGAVTTTGVTTGAGATTIGAITTTKYADTTVKTTTAPAYPGYFPGAW